MKKIKILRIELLGAMLDKIVLIVVGKEFTMISSTMFVDGLSMEEYKDKHDYRNYIITKVGQIEEAVIGKIIKK